MKKISTLLFIFTTLFFAESFAQEKKPLSPKDSVEGTVGGAKTKIVYCRPSARGRKMIGEKEPYGKVWRTGANEATTVEFSKAVKIGENTLPAGKYALFTIPGENEWTIIFNKEHKQWGAYNYKESEDVLRVKAKPSKTGEFVETFTIQLANEKITLKWENTAVDIDVKKI